MNDFTPRKWDIIVLGASGFTGQFVAKYLNGLQTPNIRWAIAGRSEEKLREISQKFDLKAPIEIVDVYDSEDLDRLCGTTRLILNCTGPYFLCGEPVVQSCVKQGTHYLDIAGEPLFIEEMMLKYHFKAKANHATLVHACGFDSLPSELGVLFTMDLAKQRTLVLQAIDAFIRVEGKFTGHLTSLESGIHGYSNQQALREVRSQLKKMRWTKPIARLGEKHTRSMPFYRNQFKSWFLLFFGPDASIVRNTQYALAEQTEDIVFPWVSVYFGFKTHSKALAFLLGGLGVFALGGFAMGRRFLLNHPGLFTGGIITKKAPTESELKNCSFRIDFLGTGLRGERVQTFVSGPEPGYVATPILLVQAALTLLENPATLSEGGVFTPGVIFPKTDLIERLKREGITYGVVE